MWKSAYVGVYRLLNWRMHGEKLKLADYFFDELYNFQVFKKSCAPFIHGLLVFYEKSKN